MSAPHPSPAPFDIPDVIDAVPRRLKPWLIILFVLIIQFAGGIYPAVAHNMVGSTALLSEDVRMAAYASLTGMAINFAVMFRIKFRFAVRTQLLVSVAMMIAGNIVCSTTTCVPLLVGMCFVTGWFRMQATFACNSSIQLWLTPVRDMSLFFCYVYILVDSVIQLGGVVATEAAYAIRWEYINYFMITLLVALIIMILIFMRPVHFPLRIPFLGIDWLGAILWSIAGLAFIYVCTYGEHYDWWEAEEIRVATLIWVAATAINLLRATFLRHPYISFRILTNSAVLRAAVVYAIFFTLLAAGQTFLPGYATAVLGYEAPDMMELNCYELIGIVVGCTFTYLTFVRRRWSSLTITVIAFSLACVCLAYDYFTIDYNIEKNTLGVHLAIQGAASVIISIIFLTSIVRAGLPFNIFPQALTVNSFFGAVMPAALCPAIMSEWLRHTIARNVSLLSVNIVDTSVDLATRSLPDIYSTIYTQAWLVSIKEIYGYLLPAALITLAFLLILTLHRRLT